MDSAGRRFDEVGRRVQSGQGGAGGLGGGNSSEVTALITLTWDGTVPEEVTQLR